MPDPNPPRGKDPRSSLPLFSVKPIAGGIGNTGGRIDFSTSRRYSLPKRNGKELRVPWHCPFHGVAVSDHGGPFVGWAFAPEADDEGWLRNFGEHALPVDPDPDDEGVPFHCQECGGVVRVAWWPRNLQRP